MSDFDIRQTDLNVRGDNNIQQTKGLFYEWTYNPECIFTLRPYSFQKNGKTYTSMYQVFMSCIDEYEAAERLLGSQAHWRKLSSIKWFAEGVAEWGHEGLDSWREDMRARDESKAKAVLMEQAANGNVNAAKALMDKSKVAKAPAVKPKVEKKSNKEEDELFVGFMKAQQGSKHVN
jgi:hypothetical protein